MANKIITRLKATLIGGVSAPSSDSNRESTRTYAESVNCKVTSTYAANRLVPEVAVSKADACVGVTPSVTLGTISVSGNLASITGNTETCCSNTGVKWSKVSGTGSITEAGVISEISATCDGSLSLKIRATSKCDSSKTKDYTYTPTKSGSVTGASAANLPCYMRSRFNNVSVKIEIWTLGVLVTDFNTTLSSVYTKMYSPYRSGTTIKISAI